MSLSNSEINLYVDTMVVQAFADDKFVKIGAESIFIMPLIDKVKSYVSGHIDSGNKVGSVINFLAPGAIATLFQALGFTWTGRLLGLLTGMLHVDVFSILKSIHSKISALLGSGKEITSADVDAATREAAQAHIPASSKSVDDIESVAQRMRDVRMLKLAMIEYHTTGKIKNASITTMITAKAIKIFTTVIGWIFKTVLASAGLMPAGDAANKLLGRSNALDSSLKGGKPTKPETSFFGGAKETEPQAVMVSATQTKFPKRPGYTDVKRNQSGAEWTERVLNDRPSIENMVIGFAKEVYSGLDGVENTIKSSPVFNTLVDQIVFFNRMSVGDPYVFIPRQFVSKKQMVDFFIDDVAAKAQ